LAGLKAIGKITATREIDGRTSVETRCSLLQPRLHAGTLQCHRAHPLGHENKLHWVLDVIMDEDQARKRKDHGPQNLGPKAGVADQRLVVVSCRSSGH